MRNGFIAYHGSRYGDCGSLEDDYEGRYDTAIFFSLDPSMALEFSKGADIRHYCTYEIPYSMDRIFNPEDDYALESLQDCLLDRIENKDLVSQTIAGIAAFDWGAFNPASWVGGVVKQCLLEMGYVGWFEKEHGSDVLNFGLYSAKGVKLLRVDYFCDDCEAPLATSPRGSLICENCEQDLCPECGTEIEWDEDDEEWVQRCICDIDDVFVPFQKHSKEDTRDNPRSLPSLTRRNPWVQGHLYFRYGFWDLEPNRNMVYHVTPKLSDIMDSSELSSRASRKSTAQGLGGAHDVSISLYGSLNRAMYTLVYLYRIWQVKQGLLSIDDLAKVAKWPSEHTALLRKYKHSADELIGEVRMRLKAPNPVVFGDSWAETISEEDFAILAFANPCSHMYVEDLLTLSYRSDDTSIRALTQQSIVNLRQLVHPFSYFGARSEGLDRSVYSQIREALKRGETAVTYEDGGKSYRDMFEVVFGPENWLPAEWYGREVIDFENITIDLREQAVQIKDTCIYNHREQEFQLFRSLPMSDVVRIYTIQDALLEARQRNGGVEPFFWDMGFSMEGSPSWSEFELSTWVD